MKTVAVIVNYKSAALTLCAVESILNSASVGPVEIVVVDNSQDPDEAQRLKQGLPPTVFLRGNPSNMGFGRACNLAYREHSGDMFLLINPDSKLLPGCLLRLQETLLSSDSIAATSPQTFWDDGLNFCLPPSPPPLLFEFQFLFDGYGPRSLLSHMVSAVWRRHSIKVWRSERPLRVNNLSGGLVLIKDKSLQKTGGLFDPRFFLFFEDTDLFLRLRKAGYSLVHEPRARAIHYYDQCGREEWERKRLLMDQSRTVFIDKYRKGLIKVGINKMMGRLVALTANGYRPVQQPDFTAPFCLRVPGFLQKGWLFEASPSPAFVPSAGRFGIGPMVDFTETYWSMLAPGQYFGRLGSPSKQAGNWIMISWRVNGDA
ncbi:MAG: glycosyltransferase [Deltaproteobacteria bacterium]|nr:glycosyltransferase [Deltaproteobacteria bacterium]